MLSKWPSVLSGFDTYYSSRYFGFIERFVRNWVESNKYISAFSVMYFSLRVGCDILTKYSFYAK